jgi:diacylglycerol kinase
MVIALEMINSAIENLVDFVSPEKHQSIKKIKDLSAGAVLVGATVAAIVGLIVFLPKILE